MNAPGVLGASAAMVVRTRFSSSLRRVKYSCAYCCLYARFACGMTKRSLCSPPNPPLSPLQFLTRPYVAVVFAVSSERERERAGSERFESCGPGARRSIHRVGEVRIYAEECTVYARGCGTRRWRDRASWPAHPPPAMTTALHCTLPPQHAHPVVSIVNSRRLLSATKAIAREIQGAVSVRGVVRRSVCLTCLPPSSCAAPDTRLPPGLKHLKWTVKPKRSCSSTAALR